MKFKHLTPALLRDAATYLAPKDGGPVKRRKGDQTWMCSAVASTRGPLLLTWEARSARMDEFNRLLKEQKVFGPPKRQGIFIWTHDFPLADRQQVRFDFLHLMALAMKDGAL
jgi:hypothetical protein